MNPQLQIDLPPELLAVLRRVPELLAAASNAAWWAIFQQAVVCGALAVVCLWLLTNT